MTETVTIERMGYGAEAVAHLENGKAVFVEGGAPGDVAVLEIYEDKPTFARAHIVRLEEASLLRSNNSYVQDSAALGAPWAHLTYKAQLDAKRSNVVAALVRTAHSASDRAENLVSACLPSDKTWGYRNKIELGARNDNQGHFQLGFYREGTHEVLTPALVPLAHKAIEKAPQALRGALGFVQGTQDLGIYRVGVRHSCRTGDLEVALWSEPSSFPRAFAAQVVADALPTTSIVRVVANAGRARKIKSIEVLDGHGLWAEELCGLRFETSAPSFFQVNTEQAEKLVAIVLADLAGSTKQDSFSYADDSGSTYEAGGSYDSGSAFKSGSSYDSGSLEGLLIADLYAGGGTFSIPLARAGADVIAIESAGTSVRDLRRNAEANEVDVEVIGGDAARELPHLGNLDALVVDPPRAGLAKGVVESITAAHPQRVVYVSCNPATWARDVACFEAAGFELCQVQPVDMFPQTYHVEVVSMFQHTAL